MFKPTQKIPIKAVAGLLLTAALVGLAHSARAVTTNTFNFSNTTIGSGAGPTAPSGSQVNIYGTNLNSGDVVVYDGIVINTTGTTSDTWGAVEMNAGGYLGLTSATLGVLAETGSSSGNKWQLFINGSSTQFGTAALDAKTNRLQVILTATASGTTTNMSYVVNIDQGATGTFNATLSGSGLTFPNNVIPLAYGANNAAYLFIQTQPIIAVSAPSPTNALVASGLTATFTASLTQGYPLNTTQLWYSNGVPIPGSTSLTYTTPAVNPSYNGAHYYVVVTNLNTAGNVVTSSVATLTVRSTPGYVPFVFPTTTIAAGGGTVTTTTVAIGGNSLLAGDTVVFDGIIVPSGPASGLASDAWAAINIAGSGYGNVTAAKLGVLCRTGAAVNPSQTFINGATGPNATSGAGAATNRVRIELYPSVTGSTTNMGYKIAIDQFIAGNFQAAVTGSNLTFANNTLPLSFGSSANGYIAYQNPQSPVSVFSGPSLLSPVVAPGTTNEAIVTVEGWSPAFQWLKNGAAVPGATARTLAIPAATTLNNGDRYSVIISNTLNSANVVTSSVAILSVLIPNNLTWYPAADFTTWDTSTLNWTTNGGSTEIAFATGNNVTFDSLGYNIGGNFITLTNALSANAVTVNASGFENYVLTGGGPVSAQSLTLSGDGTSTFYIQTTNAAAFNSLTIVNDTLQVGYLGVNGLMTAGAVSNAGTLLFNNTSGLLAITGPVTGTGYIFQNGAGTTVLSATNSACSIGAINNGVLSIASTPNPGVITNNSEIQPASSLPVLVLPNTIVGTGHYNFVGFQTTLVNAVSSYIGTNIIFWGPVIVDNPLALGDTNSGLTDISGADRFGGLYLSNNVTWFQPLELETRDNIGGTAATAPHLANLSGNNTIVSPMSFNTGGAAGVTGTELNVEATTGTLTIDSTCVITNQANGSTNDLNLQGAGTGYWNASLSDSTHPLSVLMRGAGTWTLGASNSYSGTTTVSNGTLLVTGQISSPNSVTVYGGTLGGNGGVIDGPVSVAAGGTFAPGGTGSGLLTIANSLTLAGGSFTSVKINKTAASNDKVTGVSSLTYGGTLAVNNLSGVLAAGDAFPIFSASSYGGAFAAITPATPGAGLSWNTSTLTTDGTLRVSTASVINTNRMNITATVTGGGTALSIVWPTNQIGWTLEVETNPPGLGLSTNWFRITATTATNSYTAPISSTNGSVFFRLVYP